MGVVGGAIVIDPFHRKAAQHRARLRRGTGRSCRPTGRCTCRTRRDFASRVTTSRAPSPPDVVRGFGLPFGHPDLLGHEPAGGLSSAGGDGRSRRSSTRARRRRQPYERWKLVFRANALTSTAYVLSVARPAPEQGVPLGGASIAIDPTGEVIAESTDPIVLVQLDEQVIAAARQRYPGYLQLYPDLYARGWSSLTARRT